MFNYQNVLVYNLVKMYKFMSLFCYSQVDDYIPLKTEGQAFTTSAFTPADIFIGNSGKYI